MATLNVKPVNWLALILWTLIIIAAAAAGAKFGIMDRFEKVQRLKNECSDLQTQIDLMNVQLASNTALSDLYAHFTYSDMKEEELNRVDRVAVMDLIHRRIMTAVEVVDWTIHENELTVTVKAPQLSTINAMSQRMVREPMVDFSTVSNAKMENGSEATEFVQEGETVQATVVVYLVKEAKK
jgi:riboflavin synthase